MSSGNQHTFHIVYNFPLNADKRYHNFYLIIHLINQVLEGHNINMLLIYSIHIFLINTKKDEL